MKIITLLLALLTASVGLATETDVEHTAAAAENTIRIFSDKLTADIDGDTATFSGNVRVDRGAATITADHLKLYYRRQENADASKQIDESAIEKIEARGKVRIQHQDTLAQAETADYDTGTGTLVLEGRRVTVSNGAYTIEGTRMVLNGGNKDMTVIGGDDSRVKAIIMSANSLF